MKTTQQQELAITILNQLGGVAKLKMMTGAYNFMTVKNGVTFRIKNRLRRVNAITILLNGKDLYDVTFYNIRGFDRKIVREYNDVYFDQLMPFFEDTTGMYLSFGNVDIRKVANQIKRSPQIKNYDKNN